MRPLHPHEHAARRALFRSKDMVKIRISRFPKIGMDVLFRFPNFLFASGFVVRGPSKKTGFSAVENGQIEGTNKQGRQDVPLG